MAEIFTLDCTLRDGGYVNNWEFGIEKVNSIIANLENTGIDVIELGFLRDEQYRHGRTVFQNMEQIKRIIPSKKKGIKYAALVEMANYYPLEKLPLCDKNSIDIIRYSFWKRKIDEAYEYAKKIVGRGYELFVQPTRVEQYSEKEYKELILRFSELNPSAIYIVDTFGLLTKEDVERYAKIAEENLPPNILLGYHAHNNMQQAAANVDYLMKLGLSHDIIIDSSVYGMGRGPGNLPTEIWTNYVNDNIGQKYHPEFCYEIYDKCLKEIYEAIPWGYSMAYLLTALKKGNPAYATWMLEQGLSISQINIVLNAMPYEEVIRFSEEILKLYIKKCGFVV